MYFELQVILKKIENIVSYLEIDGLFRDLQNKIYSINNFDIFFFFFFVLNRPKRKGKIKILKTSIHLLITIDYGTEYYLQMTL